MKLNNNSIEKIWQNNQLSCTLLWSVKLSICCHIKILLARGQRRNKFCAKTMMMMKVAFKDTSEKRGRRNNSFGPV
jgi:hypothetical protein